MSDEAKNYTLTPLWNQLLCERLPQEQIGAIVVPDRFNVPSNKAKVIECGSGCTGIIFPGDIVVFSAHEAKAIAGSDGNLILVSENATLAVFRLSTKTEETETVLDKI